MFQNPFSKANNQGTPANNPGNPASTGTPNQTGSIPNKMTNDPTQIQDDPNKKVVNNPGEGNDPLLQFGELWQDDPNNKAADPAENTGYLPKIDPAKLQEMIGKMDFTKSITPEQLAAINAGGEGATKTLLQVMNSVTQQALLTAFTANSKMVEAGLNIASTRFLEKVPTHVKDVITTNALSSSNPIMNDPAFAPVVESIRQRYQERFPKATPSQIENSVNAYFDDMASKMSTAKNKKANPTATNDKLLKTGSPDADWESWLNNEEALQTQQ